MTPNEQLVKAIRARQQKQTEFNYGIMTADAYVQTLNDCVGSDLCYKYAAKGNVSFADVMSKAAQTLTYSNDDMTVQQKAQDVYAEGKLPDGIELPKNTLMVFRHVLTTPRKDRDGDILRTQGAEVDPKMLLLWQHVHTLPIGKYLGTGQHNSKTLTVYSAVVDLNELAHDAAVMIDNDMGRFSHGFRALEFENLKEEGSGRTSGKGGFDVKRFEIMEESLVSVPSNIGADTEEIILSMVEGRKLTSPLMKQVGTSIREKRAMTIPVKVDLQLSLNGKSINAQRTTEAGSEKGCSCGGAPEETNGKAAGEEEDTDDKEMTCKCGGKVKDGVCEKCGAKVGEADEKAKKKTECPDCGAPLNDDGICEDCGYGEKGSPDQAHADASNDMGVVMCPDCGTVALVDGKCPNCGATQPDVPKSGAPDDTKAGRVLSNRNKTALQGVRGGLEEIHDKELLMSKGGKAICREGMKTLDDVIKSSEPPDEVSVGAIDAKTAMAEFLAKATPEERSRMFNAIKTLDSIDKKDAKTKQIRSLVRR